MAQSQPFQASVPTFSPPPLPDSQQFTLPPSKRQRMSPNPPSQPVSPYVTSPYAMSPSAPTPQSSTASPHFSTVQLPAGVYNNPPPPNSNGVATAALNLPQANGNTQPYQSPFFTTSTQPASTQQPNLNFTMASQSTGTMGPPSKPIEKVKEDGVDPLDVLGGTGIDLREEEQYTFQLYNRSFNFQISGSQSGTISAGNSFTQFPPGDESTFYGAGPANAVPEIPKTNSQEDYHRQVIDKAWNDAAHDLAVSRQRELSDPFLTIGYLVSKMDRHARENGLVLNKDKAGHMGTMRLPSKFPSPTVYVQTALGSNAAITATSGTFIPADSLLVDQVALISISAKHRLRALIEDAARLAKGRQIGSHGIVPPEWADVAAPSKNTGGIIGFETGTKSVFENVSSPYMDPNRKPLSSAGKLPTPISDGVKTPTAPPKFSNEVVNALRAQAAKEREYEEQRLRKRKLRQDGVASARAGSSMPGTPGWVAPEAGDMKLPTKKEQKKKAEASRTDAVNHAAANATTSQFLGGGGGSIFGKKNKKYSWMTGSASGTSTPAKILTQGLPGSPSPVVNVPEKLTSDGVRRLGAWREDKEKGRGIQMRDWITALEGDGREKRALQRAYIMLDEFQSK